MIETQRASSVALGSQFVGQEMARWSDLLNKRRKVLLVVEDTIKRHAFSELSAEGTGEISNARLHSADLATNTQEIGVLESLSEKNIKSIHEIEEALDRLSAGQFGRCQNCEDPIAVERLKLVPESRFCVDCEREFESAQKQMAKQPRTNEVGANRESIKALRVLSQISIADIMQENPVTVNANESLDRALELLSENKFRHLPVVDDDGNIQGLISDRDLLSVLLRVRPDRLSERLENSWSKRRVGQAMTKNPETVGPETTLYDAGTLFLDNQISCLPVTEGNHLVGIVTESDFVRLVSQNS